MRTWGVRPRARQPLSRHHLARLKASTHHINPPPLPHLSLLILRVLIPILYGKTTKIPPLPLLHFFFSFYILVCNFFFFFWYYHFYYYHPLFYWYVFLYLPIWFSLIPYIYIYIRSFWSSSLLYSFLLFKIIFIHMSSF